MLKSISYNKLKKYQLITSIIILSIYLVKITLSQYIPNVFLVVLMGVGLVLYTGSSVVGIHVSIKRKSALTDEMSRANESKAAEYTFIMTSFALLAILFSTYIITWEIVISFDLVFSVYIALQCVKDGYYLYLERVGYPDARVNDEN